jgi:hypothetical protein
MIHAVFNRKFGVANAIWAIHRLQKEMREPQPFKL